MFRRAPLVVLMVLLVCVCSGLATAETVNMDLLGGIGDFEYSGDTRWYSGYTGSDYNFDTQSGFTTAPSGGWRSGYDLSTTDNSVAVGWVRRTGPWVHPRNNVTYSLVPSEQSAGNCQFLCLKRVVGDPVYARVETHVRVRNGPSDVHEGDTVTFRVDSIRMSGYSNLPTGTRVEYKIGFAGGSEKVLEASGTSVSSEISWVVPANVGELVIPYVSISVTGPLGSEQPGVLVDGAHLFLKRASDPSRYLTWDVPVTSSKGVRTLVYRGDWRQLPYDLYEVAKNCDAVVLSDGDGALAARLKYLNPSIRTYLYQIYTCIDRRDTRGIDPWYSSSPTQMGWVRKNNHTDWLYTGGTGAYGYVNEPDYPHSYYARVTNTAFQSYWLAGAMAKALRWRHQGVYMDTICPLTQEMLHSKIAVPQRLPYEVQKFLHATVPSLRSAGLDVVANIGGNNAIDASSSVFLNPRWTPIAPYNTSQYTSNQRIDVPNIVFQEWGFIRAGKERNGYYTYYWLKCLQDMDTVKSWNTTADGGIVPANDRIYYSIQMLGTDIPDDPAAGIDGWYQFGLASYLLGQNDWTSFSWHSRGKLLDGLDYSGTSHLGAPDGERASIGGDPCFVYRRYKTADGGRAVVVVNANPEDTRNYVLDTDVMDEKGAIIAKGTTVTLKPHTGRIFVNRATGITISVGVPSLNVSPGQTVAVVVSYTNNSARDASDVLVSAGVPDQVTYSAGSAEASGGTYSAASNTVSWRIPFLESGGQGTRTFNVRVK